MGDGIDSTHMHINDLPIPIPLPIHKRGLSFNIVYYLGNDLGPCICTVLTLDSRVRFLKGRLALIQDQTFCSIFVFYLPMYCLE